MKFVSTAHTYNPPQTFKAAGANVTTSRLPGNGAPKKGKMKKKGHYTKY